MKIVLAMMISLTLTSISHAEERRSYFPYDRSLTYQQTNTYGTDIFVGDITIAGTVFYVFEVDVNQKNLWVAFSWFVPEAKYLGLLPNSTNKRIEYISLEPAKAALTQAFGENGAKQFLGTNKGVYKFYATLTLRNFMVSAECDTTVYSSTSFTITPDVTRVVPELVELPNAC